MRIKSRDYTIFCYENGRDGKPVHGDFTDQYDALNEARDLFALGIYDYVFVWETDTYYPEDNHGLSGGRVLYSFIKRPVLLKLSDGRYIVDTPEALHYYEDEIVRAIDVETLETLL